MKKYIILASVIALFLGAVHANAQFAPVCTDLKLQTSSAFPYNTDPWTGGEISKLQKFLQSEGDYTYPEITGYFGAETEKAVQKFQSRNGIVSSGTPATTGYGAVGPKTRAIIFDISCSIIIYPVPALKGTLSVSLDASSPAYRIVSGGTTNQTVSALRFSASNEDVLLQSVALKLGNEATGSDLSIVTLWDGSTQVGQAVFIGSSRNAISTFINPILIPNGGDKIITVKASLASIGVAHTGTSGHLVQIDYDGGDRMGTKAVGQTTGGTIYSSTVQDTQSTGVRMFRSFPTVALAPLPSVEAGPGLYAISRFSIKADSAGDISLAQVRVPIGIDPTATVLSPQLYAYTDSAFTQPVSGFDVEGKIIDAYSASYAGSSSALFAIKANASTGTRLVIPAGETRYFEVRGLLSKRSYIVNNAPKGDSKFVGMTDLFGVAGEHFIWSPNSTIPPSLTTKDWTNGYGVVGLGNSTGTPPPCLSPNIWDGNDCVPNTAKFVTGDSVVTTDAVKVRREPSLSGFDLYTATSGTKGTIVSGPISADGYVWYEWYLGCASSTPVAPGIPGIVCAPLQGWTVENYLQKSTQTSPSITVLSPNGGETLVRGSQYKIAWKGSESMFVDIETVVRDSFGGLSIGVLATNVPSIPGDNSFVWTVGKGVTGLNTAIGLQQIRICKFGACREINDTSDTQFTVTETTQPSITVLSPNGGEILAAGEQTIKWQHGNVPTPTAVIDLLPSYYCPQGQTCPTVQPSPIHLAVAPSIPGINTAKVTLPTVPGNKASIRICLTDCDTSDASFTITSGPTPPPTPLTIISPKDAVVDKGQSVNISWSDTGASASQTYSVSIQKYDRDRCWFPGVACSEFHDLAKGVGGTSYSWNGNIVRNIGLDTPLRGRYELKVCRTNTTKCSSTLLSIDIPDSISITSPSANALLRLGEDVNISWTDSVSNQPAVPYEVYISAGEKCPEGQYCDRDLLSHWTLDRNFVGTNKVWKVGDYLSNYNTTLSSIPAGKYTFLICRWDGKGCGELPVVIANNSTTKGIIQNYLQDLNGNNISGKWILKNGSLETFSSEVQGQKSPDLAPGTYALVVPDVSNSSESYYWCQYSSSQTTGGECTTLTGPYPMQCNGQTCQASVGVLSGTISKTVVKYSNPPSTTPPSITVLSTNQPVNTLVFQNQKKVAFTKFSVQTGEVGIDQFDALVEKELLGGNIIYSSLYIVDEAGNQVSSNDTLNSNNQVNINVPIKIPPKTTRTFTIAADISCGITPDLAGLLTRLALVSVRTQPRADVVGAFPIRGATHTTTAATVSSVPACPSSQPSITVISPNGGESYSNNSTISVQYTSKNIIGEDLTAYILVPGSSLTYGRTLGKAAETGTISIPIATAGVPNSGSYVIWLCAPRVADPLGRGTLCDQSKSFTISVASTATDSLSATLIDSTSDKAGKHSVFGPGQGAFYTPQDWHVTTDVTLATAKTISSIELTGTTSGYAATWSTSNPNHYPLVVFQNGTQKNFSYGTNLGSFGAGSFTLDLYAQKDYIPLVNGKVTIKFSDGSSVSNNLIGQVSVMPIQSQYANTFDALQAVIQILQKVGISINL